MIHINTERLTMITLPAEKLNWLLNHLEVIHVIADMEKDNIASHRVLDKVGASVYKEAAELLFWRFS